MRTGRPELRNRVEHRGRRPRLSLSPGPSWPKTNRARLGSAAVSSATAPGALSMATSDASGLLGVLGHGGDIGQVHDVLVAVRDHRPAPVPPSPAHDDDLRRVECVGRADDGADVGVVLPVLDGDRRNRADDGRGRRRWRPDANSDTGPPHCDYLRARSSSGSKRGSSGQGWSCGPTPTPRSGVASGCWSRLTLYRGFTPERWPRCRRRRGVSGCCGANAGWALAGSAVTPGRGRPA